MSVKLSHPIFIIRKKATWNFWIRQKKFFQRQGEVFQGSFVLAINAPGIGTERFQFESLP
jgi:hypothetical protein